MWSAVRERWRFTPDEKRDMSSGDVHAGWSAEWRTSDGKIDASEWVAFPPARVNTRPRPDSTRHVDIVELPARVPPLPDSLLCPERWKLVVEGAWKSTSAIHTLEARISLLGLRRAARCVGSHHKRVLSIGDNMSEIVASEKGRAADFSLRSLIKRSAAYQLGCGIMWRRRHVDTKRNISDAASRKADRGVYKPGERRVGPGGHGASPLPVPSGTPAAVKPQEFYSTPRPPEPVHRRPQAATKVGSKRVVKPKRRAILELFSGCGRFSGAAGKAGFNIVCPFELDKGCQFDVLNPKIEKVIRRWISSGKIWHVHFGTPCTIWSVASSPDAVDKKQGYACAVFTLRLLKFLVKYGVSFTIENPASSALFKWEPMAKFLWKHAKGWARTDYCRWGASFLKPTIIVSSLLVIQELSRRCMGGHRHEHLQGIVKVLCGGECISKWKTSLAGAYPPALCHAWVQLLGRDAPAEARCPHSSDCMSSDWETELCNAINLVVDKPLPTPTCPSKWVDLWPADAASWGQSWGPWIAPKACVV